MPAATHADLLEQDPEPLNGRGVTCDLGAWFPSGPRHAAGGADIASAGPSISLFDVSGVVLGNTRSGASTGEIFIDSTTTSGVTGQLGH